MESICFIYHHIYSTFSSEVLQGWLLKTQLIQPRNQKILHKETSPEKNEYRKKLMIYITIGFFIEFGIFFSNDFNVIMSMS